MSAAAEAWRAAAWVDSQPGVAEAVAAALLAGGPDGDELAFLRSLPSCTEAALSKLLMQGGVIDKLAACLSKSLAELQAASAASAEELHDKFVADGTGFTLRLSGLNKFFGGLEGFIGSPSPQVERAMEREHCELPDSTTPFETPNRKTTTTSIIEWRFVANPAAGADGIGTPFVPYPNSDKARQPRSFDDFEGELTKLNMQLEKDGHTRVGRPEFWAARLYSGPMYLKYNAVLRGLQFPDNAHLVEEYQRLCAGNMHTTTLHVVNSAIIKLSKLTKATKVYRGVWGGVLPEVCRVPNEYGVRGGVEGGFMSTTTDKATALFYASGGAAKPKQGGPAIVFETQMGMVNRGADISWLSQFPGEQEILFAPLTGMEVRGSRVEGSVQVYEVALSVNMASLTIEQVLKKRKRLVEELRENMLVEVRADLAGSGLEGEQQKELARSLDRALGGVDYNHDAEFVRAVQRALELKNEASGIIVKDLRDEDDGTREAAWRYLGHLHPSALAAHAADVAALLRDDSDKDLLSRLVNLFRKNVNVREKAVRALAKLEPAPLAKYAADTISKLEDADENVRGAAVATLDKLERATLATHGASIAAKLEHADWHVRCVSMQTLSLLPPDALGEHAGALVATLQQSRWPYHQAAAEVLRTFEQKKKDEQAAESAAQGGGARPGRSRTLSDTVMLEMQDFAMTAGISTRVAVTAGVSTMVPLVRRTPSIMGAHQTAKTEVTTAAVELLGRIDAATVLRHEEALEKVVEEDDVSIRPSVETLLAVVRLKSGERDGDHSPHVLERRHAVAMLGVVRAALLAQHAPLIVTKLRDANKGVRYHALHALGGLAPEALAPHAEALVGMLLDSDEVVRYTAVETLGKLEPWVLAQHATALVAMLAHADKDVRFAAVETLGLVEPEALSSQHTGAVVALLDDSWHNVRLEALKTLFKLEPAALAQHAAAVVAKIEDPHQGVRCVAVEVLGRLDVAALKRHEAAVAAKLDDPDARVQVAAHFLMHVVAPHARPPHMDAVVERLAHPDAGVRYLAVQTLGKFEAAALSRHAGAVLASLDDSEAGVRAAAVETLGRLAPLGRAEHRHAVAKAANDDSVLEVREVAARVLRRWEPASRPRGHWLTIARSLVRH